MKTNYCIVLTTFGNSDDAKKTIDDVLEQKLAACVQTFDIKSHYFWNGEICHDPEVMVLFKTKWDLYHTLEARIKDSHPYDTPEVIAVNIENGSKQYLSWIDEVTQQLP